MQKILAFEHCTNGQTEISGASYVGLGGIQTFPPPKCLHSFKVPWVTELWVGGMTQPLLSNGPVLNPNSCFWSGRECHSSCMVTMPLLFVPAAPLNRRRGSRVKFREWYCDLTHGITTLLRFLLTTPLSRRKGGWAKWCHDLAHRLRQIEIKS